MTTNPSAGVAAAAPSFANGVRESAQAARAWLGRSIQWAGEKGSNLISAIVQIAKSVIASIGTLLGKLKEAGSEGISASAKFARENSRELRFAAIGDFATAVLFALYQMCKRTPDPKEPPATGVKVLPKDPPAKNGVNNA